MTQTEKIDRFWRWFGAHQAELKLLELFKTELYPLVISEIHKVALGLVVDFEIGETSDKYTLIVSAEGNLALFPLVVRVVDRAPAAIKDGWQVTAFRQPRQGHFALQFPDYRITTENIVVKHKMNPERRLDIKLKVQDWDESMPGAKEGIRVLVENLVGEYNARIKIGRIEAQHWELGEPMGINWVPAVRLGQIVNDQFGQD